MESALPFRRYDEVDEHLNVLRRGPSEDRLEPAPDARLEPEVFAEVSRLVAERRLRSFSDAGLIGLDHAVYLSPVRDGSGTLLVCIERVALRGSFERLAERVGFTDEERLLARLLVGPYDEVAIAWRLGCGPLDAISATRRLYRKTGVYDRLGLQRAIDGHVRSSRRRTRTTRMEERILSIA